MFSHSKSVFIDGKQYTAFANHMTDELRITCEGNVIYRDSLDEYTNFDGNMEAFLKDHSLIGADKPPFNIQDTPDHVLKYVAPMNLAESNYGMSSEQARAELIRRESLKTPKGAIDLNGLRLCKAGKHYKVSHIPTGKDIGLVANRLKDLKPVFETIANAYQWNDWDQEGVTPLWANKAFNDIIAIRNTLDRF